MVTISLKTAELETILSVLLEYRRSLTNLTEGSVYFIYMNRLILKIYSNLEASGKASYKNIMIERGIIRPKAKEEKK